MYLVYCGARSSGPGSDERNDFAQREEGRMTNLGADRARGADPVPRLSN